FAGGVQRGEPLCMLRMVNERTPVQPPHGEGRLAPEDATGLLCAPALLVCGRGSKGSFPLAIFRMLNERTLVQTPHGEGRLPPEDAPGLLCAPPLLVCGRVQRGVSPFASSAW